MNNQNQLPKNPPIYTKLSKNSIYISPINNTYGQYCYCKITGATSIKPNFAINKSTIPK